MNSWVKKDLGITGNFEKAIGFCIVKTYDENVNGFKLNSSAEFIGTLAYYPLS
jgi:hypothetical protein